MDQKTKEENALKKKSKFFVETKNATDELNDNKKDKKKKKKQKQKKKKKKDDLKSKKKSKDDEEEDSDEKEEKDKKAQKEKQDIIADHFVLLMEMGRGAFGHIYLTYNMNDNEEVATKKEIKKIGKTAAPQLKMEFIVYKTMLHVPLSNQNPSEFQIDYSGVTKIPQEEVQGFPKFYGYGETSDCYYLIMQLLGPNLVELFHYCQNRKLTAATVCMVAIQILNRIEYFHKHHYLHRDIKPENFLIGCGDKSNFIYLIDYGLCKKYKDPKTHQHIPYREGRLLTGTARYVSINTHLGIEQSRRDDLESIGYVLVFFLKGSLPWQGLKGNMDKYNKIMEKKLQIPTEILCYGLPDEIVSYLNYCKSLRFEDRPDYDYLRGLFVKLLYSCISSYNLTKEQLKFDWCFEDPNSIWNMYNKKKTAAAPVTKKQIEECTTPTNSKILRKNSSLNYRNPLSDYKKDNKLNKSVGNDMSKIDEIVKEEHITPVEFEKSNENNLNFHESDHKSTESDQESVKSDVTVKKENLFERINSNTSTGQNTISNNVSKLNEKELIELININNTQAPEDIDHYVNKLVSKLTQSIVKVKIMENNEEIRSNNRNSLINNSPNILVNNQKDFVVTKHKDSLEIIRSQRSQRSQRSAREDSEKTIELKNNNKNFANISQFVNDYSESGESPINFINESKKLASSIKENDENPPIKKQITSTNLLKKDKIMEVTPEEKLANTTITNNPTIKISNQHTNLSLGSNLNRRASAAIIMEQHAPSSRKKKNNENDLFKSQLIEPIISPRPKQESSKPIINDKGLDKSLDRDKPPPNYKNFQEISPILTSKKLHANVSNNRKDDYLNSISLETAILKTKKSNEGLQSLKDSLQPINRNEENENKKLNIQKEASNSMNKQKGNETKSNQNENSIPEKRRKSKVIDQSSSNAQSIKFSKDSIIKVSSDPIQKHYTIICQLGHGSYGSVKKVKHKQLGEERAMKIVKKKSASSQNEIDILKKISHPNIISIYEIFEDSRNYYIMTELLEGGELFEVITTQGSFSEVDAAKIMKQILTGVNYLHNRNIAHRDLKPENILLINKNTINSSNYEIKLIDFGTATIYEKGQKLFKFIGTSYYIAPEVLLEKYDERCDVWSCGIILYILLCGYPPFNGSSNVDIYNAIKSNPPHFSGDEWKFVNKDAIDLIKNMLNKNPAKRFSAEICLHHKWFKNMELEELNQSTSKKTSKNVNSLAAIGKMKEFVSQNKLKQAVLQYISTQFNMKDEEEEFREIFKEFDTNNRGIININDFSTILMKLYGEIDGKNNAELIFQNMDLDGSGEISYNEFVTALIDGKNLVTNDRLAKAFKMFDKDNSGAVSVDEIRHIFGGEESKWKKIIKEVDLNGDGEIDFEEFKIMMKGLEEKELIY